MFSRQLYSSAIGHRVNRHSFMNILMQLFRFLLQTKIKESVSLFIILMYVEVTINFFL